MDDATTSAPISDQPTTVAPGGGAPQAQVAVDLRQVLADVQAPNAERRQAAVAMLEAMRENGEPNPLVLTGLGVAWAVAGRSEEAQAMFEAALEVDAKFAPALTNLANLHKLAGRTHEAREAYRRALALQPTLAEAHYGLAVIADEAGEREEAERHLRRALLFRPDYAEAQNNLGHLLLKGGKVEQAISHFRQALALQPDLRPARLNLISALYRMGHNTEAQGEVDKLLAANPRDLDALRAQASGLLQQGRLADADAVSARLSALEPDDVDSQLGRGELLLARQDYDGALALYKSLLGRRGLAPVVGLGAMGHVLLAQGHFSAARDLYQQALLLDARPTTLTLGLARALLGAGDLPAALACLRHACQAKPEAAEIRSLLIHALTVAGEADERQREIARWRACLSRDVPTSPAPEGGADGQEATEPMPTPDGRRIGLLFGAPLMAPLCEALAAVCAALVQQGWQLYGYGEAMNGAAHEALRQAMRVWRPSTGLSDAELAGLIAQDGIGVLIELSGHQPGNRLAVLARRPAPVQLSWLGDFAHPGLDEIDDLLATPSAPLPTLAPWPAPKLAPQPAATPPLLGVLSPPADVGPECLDAWGEILQALPQARLIWLTDSAPEDEASRDRLRRLLALREVDAERLQLLPRLNDELRHAVLAGLTLLLDAFPQPLGLAALPALQLGIPLITLASHHPWQQTSARLLHELGDAERGVAATVADYVSLATNQAPSDIQDRQIRAERLAASPLCDHTVYAQAMGQTIEQAWRRFGGQAALRA